MTTTDTTARSDRRVARWVRGHRTATALGTALVLVAAYAAGATIVAVDRDADLRTAQEQLSATAGELDGTRAELDAAVERADTAEGQVGDAETRAADAESAAATRQTELDDREAALDDRETDVADREKAVGKAEKKVEANRITGGVWTVGTDIKAGTYRTTDEVSGMCYWAIYRTGTNQADIVQNDIVSGGRPTVTLSEGQDFETSDCGTWDRQ